MVSPTSHTWHVRDRKRTKGAKKRKRALRAKGSTPRFPIHKEEQSSSSQPKK